MSMINDALRKAKETQPDNTRPADGPAYRPAESKFPEPRPLFSLPFLVIVLLLLAGFLITNFSVNEGPTLKVRARGRHAAAGETAPVPVTLAAIPVAQPAPTVTVETTPTPDVVAAEPTYRLQGIVYNLKHPSAVINNRPVFIGERVGDARVTAISKETVTIVTLNGQTNVLDMFH